MSTSDERLFTPRFFTMCGFTFTVFLSAFQLLPTAPFRILDRGGSTFVAGLFLVGTGLNLVALNMNDTILHLVLGVALAGIGFGADRR